MDAPLRQPERSNQSNRQRSDARNKSNSLEQEPLYQPQLAEAEDDRFEFEEEQPKE